MGNINDTRIVLGSLRYKGSPNTDLSIPIELNQIGKELVEYDRTSNINLEQLFQDEREKSNKFRPTSKFSIIFKNNYTGTTSYPPFEQNLYYVNAQETIIQRCNPNSNFPWGGYPQYYEFDFIRNDYNVSGYTIQSGNTLPHVQFAPKSSSTYNWDFYLSYPFENNPNKELRTTIKIPTDTTPQYPTLAWKAEDGIPFVIKNSTYNGKNIIQFRCPIKHGLTIGEFIKVSSNLVYTGNSIIDKYQVYSLGDDLFGSQEYIVNIINIGYTGSTFNDNVQGTFKRVILSDNEQDTISKYYVRRHKILTNLNDIVVTKTGFEKTAFRDFKQYEKPALTPNQTGRISIKESSQSYSLTTNSIIEIGDLLDNQKRPISELFFTIKWKGYFGWTTPNNSVMKQGWEFNLPQTSTGTPHPWWDVSNPLSNTQFTTLFYTKTVNGIDYRFNYIESLDKDDELDGDFCEWNDYTQTERIISEIYHKITFNPLLFDINQQQITSNTNQRGYYYKPFHKLTTKVFSDYIEEGSKRLIDNIPNYSYFSTTTDQFRWRDLYPYGYVDSTGLGVDYPFLNGVHYPYQNFIFRIIPEGTNYIEQTTINQPTIDPCE